MNKDELLESFGNVKNIVTALKLYCADNIENGQPSREDLSGLAGIINGLDLIVNKHTELLEDGEV